MEQLNIENIEIVSNDILTEKSTYKVRKRCFDFISSLIAIVIFSPLFLILGIMVKLDSPGPVFFGHTRLGKRGKKIKVYKFRTMVTNAEDILKNMTEDMKREFEENFKFENDARITKLGKFLRKSSLDELPQLLNILIGNMSVVGPRPIVEKEIEKYGIYGDKLLTIKPGLTGNWQAGGRSDTTYDERVQLDMQYIDKRNFWMDIKIIFKTVFVVFKKEGAM
ncbi:sugar transferase [Clostridium lacusfryxellense]|uniref:sugar transferase n=1 Tax=Clostridium lacusfryxellense TaxID=205328 RepID=UPI001C0D91AC|nr:sugar transferase [Clostridium lacusfryxellense]MBU3111020.1 sugar transferase [Clostridium lacusfryxellense]